MSTLLTMLNGPPMGNVTQFKIGFQEIRNKHANHKLIKPRQNVKHQTPAAPESTILRSLQMQQTF